MLIDIYRMQVRHIFTNERQILTIQQPNQRYSTTAARLKQQSSGREIAGAASKELERQS